MEPVGTTYQSARTDRPVRMTAAMMTSWRISLRKVARFSCVKAMTARIFAQSVPPEAGALSSGHASLHGSPCGLGRARCAAEARDLALAVPFGLRGRHHDPRVHLDLPEDGPPGLRHADRDVRSRPAMRGAEVAEGIRERLPEPRYLQRERREPRSRGPCPRARAAPDGGAGRVHAPRRHPDDGRGSLPARGSGRGGRGGRGGRYFATGFAAALPGRVVP